MGINEMALTFRQKDTRDKIFKVASAVGVDPEWALAIAKIESNWGEAQLSPTGAKGVFQLTTIALKDLLQAMERKDDDIGDILCGIAFLHLLYKRWGNIHDATEHFCDPKDRGFYTPKMWDYYKKLKAGIEV
jgi:hypothetical protein